MATRTEPASKSERYARSRYVRNAGDTASVMMSVMHGKHLIEFVRPTAEVIAGAIVALCLLADASKHRKANTSVMDRIEFTPNRRATAAWLIMAAYFVYLVPVQFRRMGGNLYPS